MIPPASLVFGFPRQMQSPAVLTHLKQRKELVRVFQQSLALYQERQRQIFLGEWPPFLQALTLCEQQRVAATRDCLLMYAKLEKQPPNRETKPFAATLSAACDVTDACAAAAHWAGATPPLPVYRDPRQDYSVEHLAPHTSSSVIRDKENDPAANQR